MPHAHAYAHTRTLLPTPTCLQLNTIVCSLGHLLSLFFHAGGIGGNSNLMVRRQRRRFAEKATRSEAVWQHAVALMISRG